MITCLKHCQPSVMANIQEYIVNTITKYIEDDKIRTYILVQAEHQTVETCPYMLFSVKCRKHELPDMLERWIKYVLTSETDVRFEFIQTKHERNCYFDDVYALLTRIENVFSEQQRRQIDKIMEAEVDQLFPHVYESISENGCLTQYLRLIADNYDLCNTSFGNIGIVEDISGAVAYMCEHFVRYEDDE